MIDFLNSLAIASIILAISSAIIYLFISYLRNNSKQFMLSRNIVEVELNIIHLENKYYIEINNYKKVIYLAVINKLKK